MLQRHWPLFPVLALAGALLFTNLGGDYLWADEGDTAVLARNILKFGVPVAWDGVTFTDSDFGSRVDDNLLMVSHPWLQYYVTAASFAMSGESPYAARLPFAICGLLTIAIVYGIVFGVSNNRWTALTAAGLLTVSVQFLLYARQSRYYALTAMLTCLLLYQFFRLRSWKSAGLFGLSAVLLFHSHPIAFAPVLALGALTLFYPPTFGARRWFWISMPAVAALTLPWLSLAHGGLEQNTQLIDRLDLFIPRLAQFAIECASVTSLPGAAVLFLVLCLCRAAARIKTRPRQRRNIAHAGPGAEAVPYLATAGEGRLAVAIVASIAGFALSMAVTESRDTMWMVGLRYTPAVLPFMAIVLALLIARISGGKALVWTLLVLLVGFTKLGRLTPWTFGEPSRPTRDTAAAVTFHNPPGWLDRVLRTGQIAFVRSLTEPVPGTTAHVAEYLNANANRSDIVITNYEWEPLYFHTGLPMAMTILPSYPIYAAARAKKLPEYVFAPDAAKWIVWRRVWGAYRGQKIDQVIRDLRDAGAQVNLVEAIPETVWENRENIHFRRFPRDQHIYPWFEGIPETLIYRIEGKQTARAGDALPGY